MRGKDNSMDINIFEIQQGKCCQVPGHWEKRVFPDFDSILFLRTDCSPQLHFRKLFPFPSLFLPFQKSLGECMPSEYHFQLAFFSYNGENLDATFNSSVSLRLEWWGYFCLYNSLKKKKKVNLQIIWCTPSPFNQFFLITLIWVISDNCGSFPLFLAVFLPNERTKHFLNSFRDLNNTS